MHLLIADDHPAIHSRVAEIVSESFEKITILHARSGREVLDHFASAPCDLLIMDVSMPGLSGIDVLRNLRERTSIPIILISTHSRACSCKSICFPKILFPRSKA
jgi:DNA-binding NarL/FixJ family response regulator